MHRKLPAFAQFWGLSRESLRTVGAKSRVTPFFIRRCLEVDRELARCAEFWQGVGTLPASGSEGHQLKEILGDSRQD